MGYASPGKYKARAYHAETAEAKFMTFNSSNLKRIYDGQRREFIYPWNWKARSIWEATISSLAKGTQGLTMSAKDRNGTSLEFLLGVPRSPSLHETPLTQVSHLNMEFCPEPSVEYNKGLQIENEHFI